MQQEFKQIRRWGRGLWVLALILALLVTASAGVYAAMNKELAAQDWNVFAIDANYTMENGVLRPLFPSTRLAPAKSRIGRTIFTAVAESGRNDPAAPSGWNPKLNVEDDAGVWRQSRLIDIFHPAYVNASGERSVYSENGKDKLLAPGTGDTYRFAVKNAGNVPLDYSLSIESLYEPNELYIPIRVRLRSGGRYLVGSAASWAEPADLNRYFRSGTLAVGSNEEYSLEWEWPFEDSRNREAIDTLDTSLGVTALDRDIAYWVQINIRAEASPNASPTPTSSPGTGGGSGTGSAKGGYTVPKTGDARQWLLYGSIMAVGAGGCIWWILTRRKRDEAAEERP